MSDLDTQLIIQQVQELQKQHSTVSLLLTQSHQLLVRGTVTFDVTHDGRTVEDEFEVELAIPEDYPATPPTAWEVGGRIPKDYHRNPDLDLCLGAPVEVRRMFAQDRTVLGFVNLLLIPYLFSFSYYHRYGEMPFGELEHGQLGVLRFYAEFFKVSPVASLKLLKCLADRRAPPLMRCPCGSGRVLKECHEAALAELRPHLTPSEFEEELLEFIAIYNAAGRPLPERSVMPQRMWRDIQRRRRRASRKRR